MINYGAMAGLPSTTFSAMLASSSQNLTAIQSQMDALQRNATNMSTAGFKEQLARVMPQPGGGVSVVYKLNFSQGELSTGSTNDAAISGTGLFVTADRFGQNVYTRAGEFGVINDGDRRLYGIRGRVAKGFRINDSGTVSSTLESIDITDYQDVGFLDNGTLVANINSDNPVPIYQVALAGFNNPEALAIVDALSYQASPQTGEPYAIAPANSVTQGLGTVTGQSRELSNVSPAALNVEMVNLNRLLTMVQNTGFRSIDNAYKEAMKILGG